MNIIHQLHDYDDPKSLASRFRAARSRHILKLLEIVHAETGACRIIDLGGTKDYWRAIGHDNLVKFNAKITVINLESSGAIDDEIFNFSVGDACNTSFEDGSFDICHSNSVIEHVGSWSQMQLFARETQRLAPKYYVQTPYYWFPVEPHYSSVFFHWTPRPIQTQRLMRRRHGFYNQAADISEAIRILEGTTLLDRKMMSALFPDAEHIDEKVLGLTKSLMAVRA